MQRIHVRGLIVEAVRQKTMQHVKKKERGEERGAAERESMTNVLENKRNLGQPNFCPQQIVVIVLQLHIRKMIPSTSVSIQQRGRFDDLFSVLAPLAFECVVSFAKRVLVELEKLSKRVNRKVTLCILLLVDDR